MWTTGKDFKPKRGLALKGKPCIVLRPGRIPTPCSITLLTSLNTEGLFHVDVREGSNTQADFLVCLRRWVESGALLHGDTLIMDNAAVHLSPALGKEIEILLHDAGVAIQTLPTYSPELNPCELVFARIKNFIRSTDGMLLGEDGNAQCMPFPRILEEVLMSMTTDDVIKLYRHCAEPSSR